MLMPQTTDVDNLISIQDLKNHMGGSKNCQTNVNIVCVGSLLVVQ